MRRLLLTIIAIGLTACVPVAPGPDPDAEVHAALAQAFPEPDLQASAHKIMHCESGHNRYAVNGQYRGSMQLGNNYNGTISVTNDGDVFNPVTNLLVARAIYDARGGWSAWQCRP